MDPGDYFEYQAVGRIFRGLSLQGLNKVRMALEMPLIPKINPGERPPAYRARIRPLRRETLDAFHKIPLATVEQVLGPEWCSFGKEE